MLSANLVGIFEATRDINTALDECCLQPNGEEDQQLSDDVDFSLMRAQLEQIIDKESQDVQVPENTVVNALELAQRLKSLGDNAQHLEAEAQKRINIWTTHGVKAKETKLSKLEEMRRAVSNFFTAKQLLTEVSDLSLPIDNRVDCFLQFVQIPVRANTQFALWQRLQVDFYQLKLKLQLQDDSVMAMKKTTPNMFQYHDKMDEPLLRCRDLVALCVRFQLLLLPPSTQSNNVLFNGEFIGQLWGVTQVFVKPVLVRFQYHFCSEKSQTNRVDRPEWFIGFVVESIRDRALFIEQEIQPRCSSSKVMVDVLSHFIRCLVLVSHARLESSWPVLRSDHALLSHTIDEILVGDRALRQEFGYSVQQQQHWPMLCDFFHGERLEHWIQADLHFARTRMTEDLLSAPMAWEASSSSIEYSECAGSVVSLVRMLGDRAGMLTNAHSRELYATNVQVVILREFISLAVARRDVSQRFNALFPLQEALRDWKLEYANEDFAFDSMLTLVQDTLEEEIETEATALFYEVTRALREWERKRWNLNSPQQDLSASPEIRLAAERCMCGGSMWKQRVNTICRARLLRVFATRFEDYLVEFCLRRQFTTQGIEQFNVDVTAFCFNDDSYYFAKLRVLVHLLSKYSSNQLEDKSVWYSDELFDENRSHFDALGLAPHQLAKLKL